MCSEIVDKNIDIGPCDRVTIKKMFGGTIFMDIRISPVLDSCEWVIERNTSFPTGNPSQPFEDRWVEWCRIPGQFDWEFFEETE